ncbi:hypothetical protein ACRRTK_015979 [Alexandromys fortis]
MVAWIVTSTVRVRHVPFFHTYTSRELSMCREAGAACHRAPGEEHAHLSVS